MKGDKKEILKIQLGKLKEFILRGGKNIERRARYICFPDRDFTRQRKLDFPTTVLFVLGLLKKV